MIKYLLFSLVLLLNACTSTDRTYFADTPSDKPHATLHMEQQDISSFNLFGVTVAAIHPLTINGLPVDSFKEGWKIHAFGKFLTPAGDTMLTLLYRDRDNRIPGFVRFTAQAGKTYQVTHRLGDIFIHFDVNDDKAQHITTQTFHKYKWQYPWEKTPEEEALLFAAQQGDLAQVTSLLKQGTNPNWSGAYSKFKPITVAAANGHTDVVKALLQAGVDINPINQVTPLEAACMRGHLPIVQLLLKAGAYIDLGTPLIFAAEHGYANIVSLLLKKGAYTLSRNQQGLTAFEMALRNEHQEVTRLLVNIHP